MKLADLDVLGADPVLAAAQPLDAGDAEDVRADALDPRAERDEEAAEILHVRLAGGVRDRRLAGRERRGHDRVLGRHHRSPRRGRSCVPRRPSRASRSARRSRSPRRARRTRGCAGRAGAGRSRRRPAAARWRARGARAAARRAGTTRGSGSASPRRASCVVSSAAWTRTSFAPVHSASAPTPLEELEHRLDVADPRDVRERDGLVREQARGEDRQRAVLVPGGADAAARAAGRPRSRTTARRACLTAVADTAAGYP